MYMCTRIRIHTYIYTIRTSSVIDEIGGKSYKERVYKSDISLLSDSKILQLLLLPAIRSWVANRPFTDENGSVMVVESFKHDLPQSVE